MEEMINMKKIVPLKRILFERQLTIRWLAEQCGVNEANLNGVVNGKRLPTLKLALKIARVLNTTAEELWGYILDEKTTEEEPKE